MSPRIYQYFQVILEFHSEESEMEGPHVHVVSRDKSRSDKALFKIDDFSVIWIKDKKRHPLHLQERRLAEEIVYAYKSRIIKKYIDFRDGKKIKPIIITRRLK